MEAQKPPSLSPPRSPKPPPPSPPRSPIYSPQLVVLQQPSNKKGSSRSAKIFRRVRSVFRSFPIISTPSACRMPVGARLLHESAGHIRGGTRMTGTFFGHRKSKINIAIQENPRCLPMVVLELSTPTGQLLQDMGHGLVRIALECEKKHQRRNVGASSTKLMDEPVWTVYCNGRKTGYGLKREPREDDLNVMQMLHATSMGAGVLPGPGDPPEGELTYMRAYFERVIGSRDSETYYMMNPDGNSGPELSIFFVRI